jgi:predicted HTH transcriptional regulator
LISGSNDKRNISDDNAKSLIPTTTIILPKNELIQESKEVLPNSEPLKKFGAVSVKKNSRQSIIISLLKRKKEIMIKDVSPLINGCSEKTIQRELLEMVSLGLLRKLGEKRWSRYTLAS